MQDTQSLLTIILESIFVGFGIVIPILSLIRTSNLKAIEVKDLFVLTGVQMVRVAGILYFILSLVNFGIQYNESPGTFSAPFSTILFSYILSLLYTPVMTLVLSQLFWIKKLYMKKAALITLALLLLILPSQRILLLLTQASGKYLPDGTETGTLLLRLLLNIIVFIFVTFTIILAGGKLKKKS